MHMSDDRLAVFIEGRGDDWPGGPRLLMPFLPSREPNGQTYWFEARRSIQLSYGRAFGINNLREAVRYCQPFLQPFRRRADLQQAQASCSNLVPDEFRRRWIIVVLGFM